MDGNVLVAGRLSVQGTVEIDQGSTNDLALLLASSGPGWGSGVQLKNTAANGKAYGIYSGADGNLHFADQDASQDRLLISQAGNVGIGTNAPAARLHVSGDVVLEAVPQGAPRSLPAGATLVWNDGLLAVFDKDGENARTLVFSVPQPLTGGSARAAPPPRGPRFRCCQ